MLEGERPVFVVFVIDFIIIIVILVISQLWLANVIEPPIMMIRYLQCMGLGFSTCITH